MRPRPPAILDRFRSRLLARTQRKFALVTERKRVGPIEVDFTRVADPDAVLDAICEEETQRSKDPTKTYREPLRMPYWAAVWESATAVGQHLAKRPHLLRGDVLDLGCGMGLAGELALALNASARVWLADIDRDALLLARLNTLPWIDRSDVLRVDWSVDQLVMRGRSVVPLPAREVARHEPTTRSTNPAAPHLTSPSTAGEPTHCFDFIIGSDVLYERPQWDNIEAFLRQHLARGGTVLLGEPNRPKADEFPEWITARGWGSERFVETVEGREAPLRLFELTRD
ncbi:MAG: methyltransferase domain-containing protein [Tepidisphaeraceae bacterium]